MTLGTPADGRAAIDAPTAVKIMSTLRDVKRLGFELGGNDAAVICDDAVFDDRFGDHLVTGALWTSGQLCAAVKRVYVHQSRHNELCEFLEAPSRSSATG